MNIVKRIQALLGKRKDEPYKRELERKRDFYRKEVFDREVLALLGYDRFKSLADVALYTELGLPTAIQAAFCMGYSAGQQSGKDKEGAEHE